MPSHEWTKHFYALIMATNATISFYDLFISKNEYWYKCLHETHISGAHIREQLDSDFMNTEVKGFTMKIKNINTMGCNWIPAMV